MTETKYFEKIMKTEKTKSTEASGGLTNSQVAIDPSGKQKRTRRAHNRLSDEKLAERASALKIEGLKVFPGTIRRTGNGYYHVLTECEFCGKKLEKDLRNLEKGLSSKCHCRRGGDRAGYGIPPEIAGTLGKRYGAMVQRCEKDTHVSSKIYKGRGIKVLFESRRHFVEWALATYPEETFANKDFDRIDNDGHYCPENLRLVDRSENLRNRRVSEESIRVKTDDFLKAHPDFPMKRRHVWNLFQQGKSAEEIVMQATLNLGLTEKGKQDKAERLKSKAASILQRHDLKGIGFDEVHKWLIRGLTKSEVLLVDRFKRGDCTAEALTPAVRVMVDHPELTYSKGYITRLLNQGMNGEQVVGASRKADNTIASRVRSLMGKFPETYSESTFGHKLRAGMTEEEIEAQIVRKFGAK